MGYQAACLLFGAVVSASGFGLIILNVVQHRRHNENPGLSSSDQRFYEKQYRRRLQTSALAVTLGALLGLSGYLTSLEASPVLATFYVVGLLLLALWLSLLALSDFVASRVHTSRIHRREQRLKQSLQQALVEMKNAHDISINPSASDPQAHTHR